MITKNSLDRMIDEASVERRSLIVARAVLALWKRQTYTEQADNDTQVTNYRGFTKSDARQGGLTAKYFLKHGKIEDWMVERWLKPDVRGTRRISKYWRQLDQIAKEKAAEKAA